MTKAEIRAKAHFHASTILETAIESWEYLCEQVDAGEMTREEADAIEAEMFAIANRLFDRSGHPKEKK